MDTESPKRFPGKWLIPSLGLPIATLLATVGWMSIPPDTRGIDIIAGRQLFQRRCSSCHFVAPDFPAHTGPNLHDIGVTAAVRKPPVTAAQYILESILEPDAFVAPSGRPGMPRNLIAGLEPEQVRHLIGYVASRGAFPNWDEIVQLDIPELPDQPNNASEVNLEQMQLAESVFRKQGACLNCHSLHHAPEETSVAPALFGVGLNDAEQIARSITNPHEKIDPRYQTVIVVLNHGDVVSGQLIARTDTHLQLRVVDGQQRINLRDIRLEDIATDDGQKQIRTSPTSLMPEGFGKQLRPAEIDAVVRLIRQLN